MAFRRFRINTSVSDAITAIAASMRGIDARMKIATTVFPKRHPPERKRKAQTLSRVDCSVPPCVGGLWQSGRDANYAGIAARMSVATTLHHNQQPPIRKRDSHTRTRIDSKKPSCKRPRICVNQPMRNGGRGPDAIAALWQFINNEFAPLPFKTYASIVDPI